MAVGELELAQHGADVRLDRLDADPEPQRDLLVQVAAREVAQDLELAGGQLVDVGVLLDRPGRGAGLAAEGVEDEAGEQRREDRVAGADAADRVGELVRRRSSSSRSRALRRG